MGNGLTCAGGPWAGFAIRPSGDLIAGENLKDTETRAFVEDAFRGGIIRTDGTAITRILPPTSRFTPSGEHGATKQRVLAKLTAFFERYLGLG